MKKEEEKEEEKEGKEEEENKDEKEGKEKKENNCLFLNCRSIVIEPFCDGSHQQLINQLIKDLPECSSFTLSGKKWHWKARTAAIYFSQVIPKNNGQYCKTLFASSVLNLAELVALRPDLASLHKILYFHENQLVYPVRKQQERDFQYGYNQIVSSLVADTLVFNSQYNKNSFLENIPTFLKLIPDHRPRNIPEKLSPKCRVIYFPLSLPPSLAALSVVAENECGSKQPLHSTSSNAPGLAALSVVAENECGSVHPLDSNSCNATGLAALSVVAENECGLTQKQALDKDSRFACGGYKSSWLNKNPETADGILRKKEEEVEEDKENEKEEEKCSNMESHLVQKTIKSNSEPLHIVWPHRWEHDKDPETLFEVLIRLHEEKIDFLISIIGQTFTDVPDVFAKCQSKLAPHIKTWGFVESKSKYYDILRAADVVVSTAKHEFFGVAMLEAVYFGCYPLCPNRLVYPEFFPGRYLYNTPNQLYKRLKEFCRRPFLTRNHQPQVNLEQFSWKHLRPSYYDILNRN